MGVVSREQHHTRLAWQAAFFRSPIEQVAPVERASAARGRPPCQGTLQVPPWTLNGFIPEADVPDKGACHGHRIA